MEQLVLIAPTHFLTKQDIVALKKDYLVTNDDS
jgi:hypothetical protein